MVHINTLPVTAGDDTSLASSNDAFHNPELSAFLLGLEPTLKTNASRLANGDRALAEDLYQEGAVAVVAAVCRYHSGVGTLEGYAAWCAINRMRDVKRSHVVRTARIVPSLQEDDTCVSDEDAVAVLVDGIDAASLRPLLARVLSKRQHAVVEALYYRGLSSSDASQLLGISKQRVNQLHVSAVRNLRAALGVPVDPDAN